MVIAIDGYEANVESRVGIGRYAFEIIRHIYAVEKRSASYDQLRIYLPHSPQSDMPEETLWWHYRQSWPSRFWTFVGLPLALAVDEPKAQVIFSPTHYVPRWVTIPRVMAIMDLSYIAYPKLFLAKDLRQLTTWTAWGVRRARAILTISRFSKNAIIKQYGVPQERVVVTYPGFTMPKQISTQPNHTEDYILSVGTLQPRKNFNRLIEAFSRIADRYPTLTLLIAGKKGWLYEDILDAPKKYGVESRVKFLEFIPDSDLPALYKNARLFALPSLYEGFGLPVLEAMSYGCPVVVSNGSSLPEIAGEAGFYVDPERVESIQDGLVQALEEKGDAAKKRKARASAQVKKFTWEQAARQTLDVLEKVGKGQL